MNDNIFAWMAGFVDGEGCLTIQKQVRKDRPTPQWRVFITIANTNKDSLDIFQNNFGGTLRFNSEKRCNKKTGVKWSDSWTWYCKQTSVRAFCESIMPFLIVKRKQAEIIISFINHQAETERKKGGRCIGGRFLGSQPLSEEVVAIRDSFRDSIQDLNSGKRFKIHQ